MISQRLSLNMPRLNQNQRIQALTMLACSWRQRLQRRKSVQLSQKHNNSVAPAFPANRWGGRSPWTRLTKGYKPSNLQVHYPDAPSTSFSNGDKFCKAVQYQQTGSVAPPQASPATHSAKEALCGTSAYSTSSGCPFAVGTTAFLLGATAVGSDSIL